MQWINTSQNDQKIRKQMNLFYQSPENGCWTANNYNVSAICWQCTSLHQATKMTRPATPVIIIILLIIITWELFPYTKTFRLFFRTELFCSTEQKTSVVLVQSLVKQRIKETNEHINRSQREIRFCRLLSGDRGGLEHRLHKTKLTD